MRVAVLTPTPVPSTTSLPIPSGTGVEDTFLGLNTTAWTGVMALLTAGLLIAAVVAALYAGRQWGTAKGQAADARTAQAEASRPYVVVSVQPSGASRKLFDLVVENIGVRPAFDVRIRLDPPPVQANEVVGYRLSEAKFLNEPMAMLAPGRVFSVHYDSHLERAGRDDLPTSHTVRVTYKDSTETKFDESSVLDLHVTKGATYVDVKTVHDVSLELEKIAKLLSSSSILGREGWLHAEVDTESRAELERRQNQEQALLDEQRAQWEAARKPSPPAESIGSGGRVEE